jgi:hypothetical protein
VRAHLPQAVKMGERYQREGWLLDAVILLAYLLGAV